MVEKEENAADMPRVSWNKPQGTDLTVDQMFPQVESYKSFRTSHKVFWTVSLLAALCGVCLVWELVACMLTWSIKSEDYIFVAFTLFLFLICGALAVDEARRRYLLVLAANGAIEIRWFPKKYEHHLPYVLEKLGDSVVALVVRRLTGAVDQHLASGPQLGIKKLVLYGQWNTSAVREGVLAGVTYWNGALVHRDLRDSFNTRQRLLEAGVRALVGSSWGEHVRELLCLTVNPLMYNIANRVKLIRNESLGSELHRSIDLFARTVRVSAEILSGSRFKVTKEGRTALVGLLSIARDEVQHMGALGNLRFPLQANQLAEFMREHAKWDCASIKEDSTHRLAMAFVAVHGAEHFEEIKEAYELGWYIHDLNIWVEEQLEKLDSK